jgi:hypothetical protein
MMFRSRRCISEVQQAPLRDARGAMKHITVFAEA